MAFTQINVFILHVYKSKQYNSLKICFWQLAIWVYQRTMYALKIMQVFSTYVFMSDTNFIIILIFFKGFLIFTF